MISFFPNSNPSIKKSSLAFSIILSSIFILKPKLLFNISDHFLGGIFGDGAIYLWLSKSFPNYLSLNNWFNTNGFYPYSQTLSFSDNWIVPSMFFYGLRILDLAEPLSYNIIYIFFLSLAGFFTFYLLYNLSTNFLLSIGVGVLSIHLASLSKSLRSSPASTLLDSSSNFNLI